MGNTFNTSIPDQSSDPVDPELSQLQNAVRLTLLATLIATGSMCAKVLREDKAFWGVIKAQTPVVEQATTQNEKLLGLVNQLIILGRQHPDYQRSVLVSFDLSGVPQPTNAVVAPVPPRKP